MFVLVSFGVEYEKYLFLYANMSEFSADQVTLILPPFGRVLIKIGTLD